MEQFQKGMVDILEIYHARQVRDGILAQLKRLRSQHQHLPIHEVSRHKEVVRYYEALLLTVAEMLQQMGDTEIYASGS